MRQMSHRVLPALLLCMSLRGMSIGNSDAIPSSKPVEMDAASCPTEEIARTPTPTERLLAWTGSGKCALFVIALWLLLSYVCITNIEEEEKRKWLKDRLFKDLMQNILVLLEFMEGHDYDSDVSHFLLLVVFAYFASILGEIYRLTQIACTWSSDDMDEDAILETYDNCQFVLGCVLAVADVISGNLGKSPTLLAKCSIDALDFLDKKREAAEAKELEAALKSVKEDRNNLKQNETILLAIKRQDQKLPDVADLVQLLETSDASDLVARILCDIKRKKKQTCVSVVRDMDSHKANAALSEMGIKDVIDILESLGKAPVRKIFKILYNSGSTERLAEIWTALKKKSVVAADAILANDEADKAFERCFTDRDEAIEKARTWYLDPHCCLDDGLKPSKYVCSSLGKGVMQQIADAEVEMVKLSLKDLLTRANGWIDVGAKESFGYRFCYGHEPVSYIKRRGYWCTALHYAVYHAAKTNNDSERLEEHLKIIRMLLRKGANPALRDGWGHDVFELAAKIQKADEGSEEIFDNGPVLAKILDFIKNQSPSVSLEVDEETWEKIKGVLESCKPVSKTRTSPKKSPKKTRSGL